MPLLAAHAGVALASGQAVAFAVRPEKMSLHREAPGSGPNALAGKVVDIAYLGDTTLYRVRLASGLMARVALANTARDTAPPFTSDEPVVVAFAPEAALLLDP